ncbi:type VI secretion system tip protein VgrG [Ralstonia pseudosolanacearum]|uniref:Putative vgr-related protein n=1 Tax=Ralstonia solanacearum TaxID=305 RepID=A0A0S4X202_RALSL|nr:MULTISPECIES: type VI secretion system tip protein VgrG [Ralstonia]OIT11190.1 type VI secretion protein [Ralstonia solanacearum]UZF31433.1 type VI secretion system tip protein VgrG [Ralstonia sp. RS650]CUV28948.1 putative vgr-related protein [Ralstonia solanacearum]CUV57789.1 putative vgr-related protein [Ralstonia solanacearum]
MAESDRTAHLHDILFFQQSRRLLGLSFPKDDAPTAADPRGRSFPVQMVVERLEAQEGLGQDFRFELTLLADHAGLVLADMLGKLLAVSLVKPDGTLRWFTGHVAEFSLVGSDPGVATYRAVLRPWLWFARQRVNNRVFRDRTLYQQIADILQGHGDWALWQWDVSGDDVPFTMAVQGGGEGESEHNYIHRRLEARGWTYYYKHDATGHQLVIIDSNSQCPPVVGNDPRIPFQAEGGPQEENAIQRWTPVQTAVAALFAASAFDFKRPQARHHTESTQRKQGRVPELETHEYVGHYGFRKEDPRGAALLNLRREEIEAHAQQYQAEGNNSSVVCGGWFYLFGHFSNTEREEDSQYLIVEASHSASNNYLAELGRQGGHMAAPLPGRKGEYRNRFTAIKRAVPWRPGRGRNSVEVKVDGHQTARVVGRDGLGAVDVDEHGRILIQFHWDREGKHSARVRVASNWAGGETGMVSWPRVGSEVLVVALDGNPDHFLVIGVVHNAQRMPPWQLPTQGVLMGIRSRELTPDGGNDPGGRSNLLALDDTAGRIQAQLKSDHLNSSLSLGHITRIDGTAGRQNPRGQGYALDTEGHGVNRAAAGLQLTTEALPAGQRHMMDVGEPVARLTVAHDMHECLSEAARTAGAQQADDQDEVARSLKQQNADLKGSGGDPAQGRFPEFQQPHLMLASPAGIESSTAGSTHQQSNAHHAITSGGHASIASGRSFLASAKDAIRLFAYRLGLKLVAASGDIDMHALKNGINILAKLEIKMEGKRVDINGTDSVRINGGGSYIDVSAAGIVHGTNGAFEVHAGNHSFAGPDSRPVVPHAVASALKPGEPIPVVDALGNVLPDSRVIVRPGQNETRTGIDGGKIDPEIVLNQHVLRRWRPRRG